MINVKINQINFIVKDTLSILEVCRFVGIRIPRFCYHENLSIAGNCRMCLVKLETNENLIISCLTRVQPNMEILSEDPSIQKAREEIIEFLLLNHPLDCPICDQAGECDLQDQAKNFGGIHSKFFSNKTTVDDKNVNPFIKTIMTRCIHCTRCVRFSTEVSGVDYFGTLNRGHHTEIGVYSSNLFDSEISGNVIDLCPVGALTSKSYTFKARPWELRSVETIDLTDGLGSNIYANTFESEILRILPKLNKDLNENIISDKARFSYDSFNNKNILTEVIKHENFLSFNQKNILNFFQKLKTTVINKKIIVVVNEELSLENLQHLENISIFYPNIAIRSYILNNISDKNLYFNTNNNINRIYNSYQNCFLFAVNPKTESALINTRLRYLNFNNFFNIYSIGCKFDSTIKTSFINFKVSKLIGLIESKSKEMSSFLIKNKSPLMIFGLSIEKRGLNRSNLELFIKSINPSAIFLNILNNSNSVGNEFLNIKSLSTNDVLKAESVFYLNCKETNFTRKIGILFDKNKESFWFNNYVSECVIRNGFDIPVKNFFEETGMFLNLESRPQKTGKVLNNNNNARSYKTIFSSLFEKGLKKNLYLNFIKNLIVDPQKFNLSSKKMRLYFIKNNFLNNLTINNISNYPTKLEINNFFLSTYFSKYSNNMLTASQEFQKKSNNFF